MSYQKCPVCNGSGYSNEAIGLTISPCSVCHGTKIIHTMTGQPPTRVTVAVDPEVEKQRLQRLIENVPNAPFKEPGK